MYIVQCNELLFVDTADGVWQCMHGEEKRGISYTHQLTKGKTKEKYYGE